MHLFIATNGRIWKHGILSLEAPRCPLWQSKRSGVFLSCPILAFDQFFSQSQPSIHDKNGVESNQRATRGGFCVFLGLSKQDA